MTNIQGSNAQLTKDIHSALSIVLKAKQKREERNRLSQEAKTKLFSQFSDLTEENLESEWKKIEETAQLFREAFYSGEDGYRSKRIIDLVWQGVENNKVNIDRDREDNMEYTGGHIAFLTEAGISPEHYEEKFREVCEILGYQTS